MFFKIINEFYKNINIIKYELPFFLCLLETNIFSPFYIFLINKNDIRN